MILAIDIGNTNVKAAIFNNDAVTWYAKRPNEELSALYDEIEQYNITAAILSNTDEDSAIFLKQLEALCPYHLLSHESKLPIKNDYNTPETLGRDRIAVAVAAHHLYPQNASLIIDAGTCITYDYITSEGVYKGGGISPGIQMRMEAMHNFTAKLPLLESELPNNIIGTSTKTSMQNGGVRGAIYELNGVIDTYQQKFGTFNTIITGGDAEFFANHIKSEIFVHPNLVLIGLNEILKNNA